MFTFDVVMATHFEKKKKNNNINNIIASDVDEDLRDKNLFFFHIRCLIQPLSTTSGAYWSCTEEINK